MHSSHFLTQFMGDQEKKLISLNWNFPDLFLTVAVVYKI